MPENLVALLAEHGARIANLERDQVSTDAKLDRLLFWMLGTLATSVAGLLVTILGHR